MKLISDYHVHSAFSGDSETPMEAMIKKGISIGLQRICFTDHMDYDYPTQYLDYGCVFEFEVENYFKEISLLRKKYEGQIKILAGIELGMKPDLANRLEKLVSAFPFDFVIASSHLLDNYDPYYPDYWDSIHNNTEYGIRRYFQSIRENVEAFQNFDVYGHLDYIVRYAPNKNFVYDPACFQEEVDALLKAIIQAGKGIEVNTAGLKYGLPFAHPKEEILKRFFALGGTYFTVGSDAHKPEHLAYDFSKEAERLEALQISSYYRIFENRKPMIP